MKKIKNKIYLSGLLSLLLSNFAFADVKNEEYSLKVFQACSAVPDGEALICWIRVAYIWTQRAIWILSIGVLIFAGVLYMTSGGNPKQIERAKKYIIGALSGVGVIVLGRFFLTQIVGVPWPWI